MGILDEIARGGQTSALDVARAENQGRSESQELQMQALKMEEWLTQRANKKRLNASLKGTDFTTPEGAAEASQFASDAENPEMAITLAKLSDSLKPKSRTSFGNMKPMYVGKKLIGYGQQDSDGKFHNVKSLKDVNGKKGDGKVTKVGKPSGEEITAGVNWVENSNAFGAGGETSFGLDTDDNERLGRIVASRAMKLMADAKDLGHKIGDQTAMDLAGKELESMGKNIYKEDTFGRSLVGEIEFESGVSEGLMKYLGVSTTAKATGPQRQEGETWSDDMYDYRFVNGKAQRKLK